MKNVRTLSRQEQGTAMIEMALVLPILLFLVLGMVDFARLLNYWNDTNQLAGEAARHAAVNRNPGAATGQTFQQYVRSRAETAEVREGTSDSVQSPLKVCIAPGDGLPPDTAGGHVNIGRPIEVRVTTRFYLIPLVREMIGADSRFASIGLAGEATMRLEQKYTQGLGCDNGGV